MPPLAARPYRIVALEQGSEEWHQWRKSGIGASDAAVIMGENRFKSLADLILSKRGLRDEHEMNAAMATGVALEPEARAAYCAKLGKSAEPACLQSTLHTWLRASVDGLSGCGDHLVEIKCGSSAYRWTARTGQPPDYYRAQLQHALAVTGLGTLDYWSHWPGSRPLHIVVERDDVYIARLLHEEERFYEKHLKVGSVDSLGDLA